jgi:FKBP-type peptidyl-prolyl cis-trans isomerase
MKRLFLLLALASACDKGDRHTEPSAPPPPTGKSKKRVDLPGGSKATDPHAKVPRPSKAKQVTPPMDVAKPPADAETFPSGLVFKSLEEGSGASPGPNDSVKVTYSGWKPDGTTFITIEAGGAPMPLFKTAPGFAEALQKMKVGGKAMFWLPPEIGYPGKARGAPETLAYHVELFDVIAAPATPPDVAAAPADATREKSGVAWKKIKTADGAKPDRWDAITIAYTGWDATGKIVDSSEVQGEPVTLAVKQLPKPLVEAVSGLAVGERVRVWFPASMLGRAGAATDDVCFEVELTEIKDQPKPPDAPPDVAAPPADALKTPKGVFYKVLVDGKGTQTPTTEDQVTVHYTGWTTDGEPFDSSVARGEPSKFRVTQVIAGWTDALTNMKVGDTWRVWIPEELAYKGNPSKPQGMLVFDMQLIAAEKKAAPQRPKIQAPHK